MENQKIIENIEKWVAEYLPHFSFRQYQKEYIASTIEHILNGNQLNIIEAPTGSGKSVIIVIMAGVLDKFYNKRSYILCSDLYLWHQYAEFIDANNLYFGKIKGVQGNYTCDMTQMDLNLAPCKLATVSFKNLSDTDWCMQHGWACGTSCSYVLEKKKAIASHVTLMTYQLYFPFMNDEDIRSMENCPFPPRDIVFCDECHNIPSLCQEYGALPFDLHNDCDRIHNVLTFCKEHDIELENGTHMDAFDVDSYLDEFRKRYDEIYSVNNNDKARLREVLETYKEMLSDVPMQCHRALRHRYYGSVKKSKKKLNKAEYKALNNASWIDKHNCSMKIFLQYSYGHNEYIVKTDNSYFDYKKNMNVFPPQPFASFKFAKEDVWVHSFLLSHQEATVMLSATVGSHSAFDENIGTSLTKSKRSIMDVIPSTFDFSKSPIYYLPGNKMSKDFINVSFAKNAAIINSILGSNKHINEKGIIHTGSYKNANDLYDQLGTEQKKRVFIYTTAKEKTEILQKFMESQNGVLIGPTLTEGIDLPGDGCRFIIIMKVPYPYLGDNLVKAKIQLFPNWYKSQTSNNVIQGIGRGNRTPDDWCTTYILDGSWGQLYQDTWTQYSPEMQRRIKVVQNH